MEKLKEFQDWIKHARTGQVYKYHTGFLAVDRQSIVNVVDNLPILVNGGPVDAMASEAILAFDAKRIHLFQRKLKDGVYEYIAMKRSQYGRNW